MRSISRAGPLLGSLLVMHCASVALCTPLAPSFSLSIKTMPYSKLDKPDSNMMNNQRNFKQDLKVALSSYQLGASFPVALTNKRKMINHQIAFKRLNFDYKNWNSAQGGPKFNKAYAVSYGIAYMNRISRKKSFMASFRPSLSSDLRDNITSKDFNASAFLMWRKRHNERWTFNYGLGYSFRFGKGLPFPFFAFTWNNGAKLSIRFMPPIGIGTNYQVSKKTNLGLSVGMDGNQYHASKSRHGFENPRIRYSSLTFGPSISHRFENNTTMTFNTGITLTRRLAFYDTSTKISSYDLKNTGFAQLGIRFGNKSAAGF
ncbi:DUF6268 family outer membrane beta-barrel protein [Elusimicrobiota bacterium]